METKSIEKQLTISAPDHEVWDVLVNQAKIADWASAFGKGTHAETDWAEGSEILWKDESGKTIATGIIAIFRPNEELHVDFYGKSNPEMQSPTGRSSETYTLRKMDDRITVLQVESGPMGDEHLEEMDEAWDRAVERIKAIAEG